MQRISLMAGKAMRETGQALDRMGMRGQDNWVFLEKICRHRSLMNLFDQRPLIHDNVFVAPNASVIGNVNVMDSASIWYGAVVRGDQSPIQIGGFTSIGDRSTILSIATNPTGFAARTFVGNWVTVGQNCVLKGCTVDDYATIGDGSVIQEGAYVEVRESSLTRPVTPALSPDPLPLTLTLLLTPALSLTPNPDPNPTPNPDPDPDH